MQCRICKKPALEKYLDLGNVPLANKLIPKEDVQNNEQKFPLQVMVCKNCYLSQLSIVVNPRILFSHYRYQSSISETFKKHCAMMAMQCKQKFSLSSEDLVVDIASNDGCLLQEFKKIGAKVMGVDPAQNVASIAINSGIPTVIGFWSAEIAKKIEQNHGKAKFITATNVFAHVDNIDEFVDAVSMLLGDGGIFLIEVPYVVDLVKHHEFDTIYHEHLSYFLVHPLATFFNRHAMEIVDIEKFDIHGGTIRIYIKKKNNISIDVDHTRLDIFLENEKKGGFLGMTKYKEFSEQVQQVKRDIMRLLNKLREEGAKVAAFGASAKGNTLMNYCGITKEHIDFIVDDTPEKQGYFSPGTKIPIVPQQHLKNKVPDYLLLLVWNFANEIMDKTQWFKERNGRYIIPIPALKIL